MTKVEALKECLNRQIEEHKKDLDENSPLKGYQMYLQGIIAACEYIRGVVDIIFEEDK